MRIIRTLIGVNSAIITFLAWWVHEGMSMDRAINVGFYAVVLGNAIVAIQWYRRRKMPKALPPERPPWRKWGIANASALGFLVLIALQGYGTAYLRFFAIIVFGVGNVLTVGFWLWDRHTLSRDDESER